MQFKLTPPTCYGELRSRKKFAWFPITHQNTLYWLETVEVCERFAICRTSSGRWTIEQILNPDPIFDDVNKQFRKLYRPV